MLKIIGLVAIIMALPAAAQEGQPRLVVTAEGVVNVAPDMATVMLGVTSEGRTAAQALQATSAATSAVLESVSAAGIEARDIQTSDLSLSPRYSERTGNGAPVIGGYLAGNTVVVRVRALDSLGSVLDAAVEAGGNNFNGLSFGLQDPTPVQDEARRKAVAEATRKAQLYAEEAGVTLGPVRSLVEHGGDERPAMMMREMAMADAAPPIAAGEVGISTSVTMEFAIGE